MLNLGGFFMAALRRLPLKMRRSLAWLVDEEMRDTKVDLTELENTVIEELLHVSTLCVVLETHGWRTLAAHADVRRTLETCVRNGTDVSAAVPRAVAKRWGVEVAVPRAVAKRWGDGPVVVVWKGSEVAVAVTGEPPICSKGSEGVVVFFAV